MWGISSVTFFHRFMLVPFLTKMILITTSLYTYRHVQNLFYYFFLNPGSFVIVSTLIDHWPFVSSIPQSFREIRAHGTILTRPDHSTYIERLLQDTGSPHLPRQYSFPWESSPFFFSYNLFIRSRQIYVAQLPYLRNVILSKSRHLVL